MMSRRYLVYWLTFLMLMAALPLLAQTPASSASYVRFAHLASARPAVDVYVDGQLTAQGLAYQAVSAYSPVSATSLEITLVQAGGNLDADALGKPFSITLPAPGYFTAALTRTADSPEMVLLPGDGVAERDALGKGLASSANLVVSGAYARATAKRQPMAEATPEMGAAGGMSGMGDVSAAYMLIENKGGKPDKLIAVETDAAASAELHLSKIEDGMAKMQPVEGGIEIPSSGSLELKPGSYHVMLMGITKPFVPGDSIVLTLKFASGAELHLAVPVAAS
jgi:copper(I)-binding protein